MELQREATEPTETLFSLLSTGFFSFFLCFNHRSWDRQVFETYKGAGSTGTGTDYNFLRQNFLLANYESQESIDDDDGSAYYESSHNFLVYSGNGMKR